MERNSKTLISSTLLVLAAAAVLLSGTAENGEILAGTDNGSIISVDDDETSRVADLEGVVHEIKRSKGVIASTQSGNNSILYRVGEQKQRIYLSEQNFHGFAVSDEAFFLAFEDEEKIVKISRNGEKIDSIKTGKSPHQLIYQEDSLYAGNINGSIQVFNEGLEKEREIDAGSWMGSFSVDQGKIFVAGRKRIEVNTSGHIHTVTRGFVSEIESEEKRTVLLPTTFVPHGIRKISEDKVAATNMVDGKIAVINLEKNETVREISLEPRGEPYFTSLLEKKGEYLVAGDIEKSRLYFVDPAKGSVERSTVIDGLHSVEVS